MSVYTDDLNLSELKEKAYVWVGKAFPSLLIEAVKENSEVSDSDDVPMLVALNRAFDVPPQMKPFMEFFRYPRTETETFQWLVEVVPQPEDFLNWLMGEGLIVILDPEKGIMNALNKLHLEPHALLLSDEEQEGEENAEPGLTMISDNTAVDEEIKLTPITRTLLFGFPDSSIDIAIHETAAKNQVSLQRVVDELLKNLSIWLRDEFAFLLYVE